MMRGPSTLILDSEELLVRVKEVMEQVVNVDGLHSGTRQLLQEPLVRARLERQQWILRPIEVEEGFDAQDEVTRQRATVVVLGQQGNPLGQLLVVASELVRVSLHK